LPPTAIIRFLFAYVNRKHFSTGSGSSQTGLTAVPRTEEALAAEEPLRNSKLDSLFVSSQFALEIYKAGNPQLAFEIQSRQRAPGLQNLLYQAKAYKFLKDAKGKDAALSWLGQQIPDSMRAPLSMFVLPDKTHELLWELVPSKLEGDHGAYYWLVRAAAFVLDGGDLPFDGATPRRRHSPAAHRQGLPGKGSAFPHIRPAKP